MPSLRLGYRLDGQKSGLGVAVILCRIERAFSKRRQAIEETARLYDYRTPAGMERAARRTRRSKVANQPDVLFQAWPAEDRALGFTLRRERQRGAHADRAYIGHAGPESLRSPLTHSRSGSAAVLAPVAQTAAALGRRLGQALRSRKGPAAMPGLKPSLRSRDREREHD